MTMDSLQDQRKNKTLVHLKVWLLKTFSSSHHQDIALSNVSTLNPIETIEKAK